MDYHRDNVMKQPGTGDPNCPKNVCVALKANHKIIKLSQNDYNSKKKLCRDCKGSV